MPPFSVQSNVILDKMLCILITKKDIGEIQKKYRGEHLVLLLN